MKVKYRKGVNGITFLLTLVYFTSYLLRKNLGVMLVKVCVDTGWTATALGIVMTGLLAFYGGGQLISGWLGDKIAPQRMIVCGLSIGALANIGVYFTTTIPVLTVLWCINGFAHSMIWAPTVKLMTLYLDDKEYGYCMMRIMWGSSFSTIFLRLFCPAMLLLINWRFIMLILAAFGIGVIVTFVTMGKKLFAVPLNPVPAADTANGEETAPAAVPLPRFAWPMLMMVLVGIVMHGALRDGVETWMPSFLCQTFGMPEENAIFSTVILSVFGFFAFTLFDWLYRKLFRDEMTCSAAAFAVATAAAIALYVLTRTGGPAIVSMLLMAVIIACVMGVNLMLVAFLPKRFLKSGKVAAFTGLLDAAAYLGSGIATYGFAALFENFGWNTTIFVWFLVAAAGLVFCFFAVPLWSRFRRTYSDV
ncbi:MAG: MFS transporter [Clostridia bacterium]|nr:MFS transporter [Clostridia bacterium]